MRRSSAPIIALFFAATAAAQTALPTLVYNGKVMPAPQASSLYALPFGEQGTRGLSLAELFGPQAEAWRLDSGAWSLGDDSLAERLADIFIAYTAAGWELALEASPSGVRERVPLGPALALSGEALSERVLEVWVSWEGIPLLKAQIEAWAARAGIKAKVLEVPSIKSKLMAVVRGGGKAPDLVMLQSDYLADLRDAGALQELDGLVLPLTMEKGRDAFTLEARSYAAPFYCDSQLVFYNKSLVPEAPRQGWTLADMERMAMASGVRAPAAWNAFSAYWFLPFVAGFGAHPFAGGSGDPDFSHPGWREAMAWLKGASERGFLAALERDAMMAYFCSGKTAFMLSGSYSIPELERLGVPFGVAPFPRTSPGGSFLAPMLDYKGFGIPRTSRNPLAARRLAQHLSNPAVQARFCAPLGKLPANVEAWSLSSGTSPYLPALRDSFDLGMPVPAHAAYGNLKNALWKLLRLYLDGSMSAEETIQSARQISEKRDQ